MSSTSWCLFTLILVQATPADAAGGLRGPVEETRQAVDKESVESSLLAELSNSYRAGAATKHLSEIQDSLRPMYKAIQKEADGTLSHPLVRYMLHRYFVQQYGWFIQGLEPNGGGQNKGMAGNKNLENLAEWVPSYLQDFLENVQGRQGVSLRELAVLAATIESLIHKESVKRLELTFSALELPVTTLLDQAQLRQALEVYMMIYMLGGNFTIKGAEGVLQAHTAFAEDLKDWGALQEWMHGIQLEVAPASARDPLNFSAATRVVEEIGKRYGAYDAGTCENLRAEMLQMESPKAGRVRLTEFYKKGLSGIFEFNEKMEYLRALGTLDESNTSDPLVVVPNYIASRSNCMVGSTFYAICCRNECEDLLGGLEKKFEAPTAKPEEILELIASMPSGTVEAPRKLSNLLVQRLNSIANARDGKVPLHGRLFALWMHHAFPRECPFPQTAATANPQTPDEWMVATGNEVARKTKEEMQMIVDNDGACHFPKGPEARDLHHLYKNDLPWDEAEELPYVAGVRKTTQATRIPPPWIVFRVTAPMLTLASFIVGLAICAWKVAKVAAHHEEQKKQQRVSTVQKLADKLFSTDGLPLKEAPAHYVYF